MTGKMTKITNKMRSITHDEIINKIKDIKTTAELYKVALWEELQRPVYWNKNSLAIGYDAACDKIKELTTQLTQTQQALDSAVEALKDNQAIINNLNDSCDSFMREIGKEVIKSKNLQNKLDLIESCVVHTWPKNGEILAKTIEDIINGTITGLLPEHNTESDACWCNPKIEKGLVIHNEITKN